jgi:hypothetical protein
MACNTVKLKPYVTIYKLLKTNKVYIYYVEESRPPLWSSG